MDLFNSENTNDSQGSPDTGRVRLKGGKSRYSARELLIDDDELDEELNNENGDRAYNSLTSSGGILIFLSFTLYHIHLYSQFWVQLQFCCG